MRQLFSLLQDASVIIIFKTSNFLTGTIDYLDHVIQPRRLGIDTCTMDAIKRLKPPTKIDLLSLLFGMLNVSPHFAFSFGRIAALLNRKLTKDYSTHFDILSANLTAVHELKKRIRQRYLRYNSWMQQQITFQLIQRSFTARPATSTSR